MEEKLLDLLRTNEWAALGAGLVIGLYVIGKFVPDEHDLPDFKTEDEEIAFYEERLRVLKEIKEQKPKPEYLLKRYLDMVEQMKALQAEIESLKGMNNG